MSIVILDDVKKSFGAVQVLHGVSFHVEKGQVMALIGASGSGKSTALRCIDLLETINSGRIEVCGHRLEDPKLDKRALRLDVGIVFQSYNLFPHLTIVENIMLAPVSVKGLPRAQAREIAGRVLAQVGLSDSSSVRPSRGRWRWCQRSCCSTKSLRRSTRS